MESNKKATKHDAKVAGPHKQLIASNKRARQDYHIDATWEAGIVLTGTEVKSLRDRGASLIDGYCYVEGGELWMEDRKSTRLNSSHVAISYAVFCLKKKKKNNMRHTGSSTNNYSI